MADSLDNPYQAPLASLEVAAQLDPGVRLFKISGIGLATFLSNVLGGGLLLAYNYRAMGEPAKARRAVVYSLVGAAVVMALAFLLPENVPGMALTIPQLVVMVQLAKSLQGPAILARRRAELPMRSNWLAAGIAVLAMLAQLIVLVAIMLLFYRDEVLALLSA